MKYSSFIIVVGLSGVGKTTFCNYLAELSGLRVVNSGSALRCLLSSKGIKVPTKIDTGDIFLKYFSETQLFEVVHDYALRNNANIIDGIRLPSTLNYFLSLNVKSFTIFIEAKESFRKERFLNRLLLSNENKFTTEETIKKNDSYFDEINALKECSNFIVNNNHSDLYDKAKKVWQNIELQIQ